MRFIELKWSGKSEDAKTLSILAKSIVSVEPRLDHSGGKSAVRITNGNTFIVDETREEILAKIEEATKPVTVAWAEPPKAMMSKVEDRLLIELEKHLKHEDQIRKLEAEIKAWKEAANADLSGASEEESSPIETPEYLRNRIRDLHRCAIWVELAKNKAEKEVAELNAKLKAWEEAACPWEVNYIDQYYSTGVNPENLKRVLISVQKWLNDNRAKHLSGQKSEEVESIHWSRVYATAIDVAKYQQEKLGNCKEAILLQAASNMLRELIRLGSCDPEKSHPIKWH